jgi:MoaA/NifB/PqqE/SkfB family radical SAM enzyme
VLPYTEELKDEILYGLWAGRAYPTGRSEWMPEIQLPRMDARPEAMEPAMALLHRSGYVQPAADYRDGATGYCRFVNEGSAAVAWDGMLSPCVALMHSYSCYVMRRLKEIKRYTLGNVDQEDIRDLWEASEYRGFRDLVRRFDFAPCTDCSGCHMSESNEEDCFGNTFPVCGDCLWAKGVIQCP